MSQKPDPRLDAMLQEFLDLIMDDVDKKYLLSLGQVNKELYHNTTELAWEKKFGHVSILISGAGDLQPAIAISKDPLAGKHISKTTLLLDELPRQSTKDLEIMMPRICELPRGIRKSASQL